MIQDKKIYTKFADVYDLMGADKHSQKMVEYCTMIFDKFDIKPSTGLDLCCGTGTAISHLAKTGIIMSGLDQSSRMLTVAAKKLKNKNIKLYHKALPKFKILQSKHSTKFQKYDLITCFFDSLNYILTERDLKTAFRSIYNHLNKGNWFIFDMNTANALMFLWDGHTYADAKNDMAWVWKNEYLPEKKLAYCHATFFLKKGKKYERFTELHKERAYSNTAIKKMLREVGFRIKGFYKCYTFESVDRDTNRICAVVQKK